MFYATIPGLGEDIAGDGILYLLEFDLRASEDACGTFSFAFNLAPDPPPLTTLFDPFGAAFPIELFQPLEINVACEPGCQDPCDDGLACTVDDACDGPECVGQAVDCSGQGVECNVATCDPAGTEGNCDIVTPVEDGTPCDNGQGVCKAGDCVPVEACPPGKVTFLDPPSGVVDARQPHPTGNLEPRLGISALRVEAPAGAEFTDCWNLCETSERGFGPNGIQSVVDNGDGTLTIHLVRVITEGAATTVTYKGSGDSGLFIFHPANANGDQVSNQLDILALVDHLNGVIELPWGLYSSDIAHRGAPSPLSLLALIDLLNGADLQDPWLGTPLPTAGECCTTDEQCADGLFCNGEETCTPGEGCAPGEPPCAPGQACNEKTDSCGTCECETGEDCDDGIPCTVDSCLDCFCANFADDDFCDDGLFCTGEESCDPQENCISSGDPCDPGETCNEKLDICEQPPAPASRVFMAPDGEQGSAPPVGPTKVSVQQGGTVQVMAWVVNTSPPPGGLLNAYQLIFPFSATPQADAKGTVSYVDINPGLGNGDSLFVDQKRPDWVFAYSPVALPVNYNETPPNIFGVFYADIAGYGIDITGQGILYMAEFDLQASADACGTFDFDFNLPPDQPPLTALFTPIGAAYVIQAYQALEINVECGQACVNPCTDDNPCTTGDVCIGELCMGQPVDCSGAAGPCEEAACDPQGAPGNCASVKTLPDGTPCEDEDPCTTGEMCKAGKCQGSSSDCNDADPCTIDSCEDGQCENVDINGLAESCVDDEDCQSLGAPGAICQAGVCACHHDNNLNKLDTLCLDLRNAGTGNAQGKCASQDAECNPGPAPDGVLQCTDDDENPLNGAVCVDQACYAVGEQVVIDIEVGPTSVAACGAQAFLSWDVQALDFIEFEVDPDGETGWTQIVFDDVNEQAGTLDLAVGLPVGTPCNTDNGTVEGGTMARLRFEAIGSCKTAGVAFREHNPRSSVSGSSGNLKIGGCNGEALPSGTDEMLINEAASSWTCPESSSGPPDPGAMTREVLFPPIEVSDPCAQTPPDSADWCEVLYYPACAGDLDCGKGELCIDENDCSRGCVPDEMAEEFDCGGTPCVGFCSLDDCVDGLCTIPRWPGGFDPLEYLNGGGDFFPGLTSIQCSYLDDCGTKAACPVEIRNQP
jgi:hypothetical protein